MYFVGLDLGQRRDFTAVAVVERLVEGGMLSVRHLERMELGTPYTKVAERLCEIMMHPALDGNSRLVVDATGVGRPVVDLLRSVGMGVNISAVTITGGDAARGRGEEWHVPRQDLLGHLQVLLEKGELKIARKLKEAEALVRELEAMRVTGEGREHDDLVLAVALACWRGRMGTVGFRARPLLGIPPYCSGL